LEKKFMDGENLARLKDAIDKPTLPTSIPSAGTDLPAPLRGDAPIDVNPHAHALGPPKASVAARGELSKLGDRQRAGMREYLNRK
jgi:hypothetical protein